MVEEGEADWENVVLERKGGERERGGPPNPPTFLLAFFSLPSPDPTHPGEERKVGVGLRLVLEGKEASRIFAIPFFGLNSSLEGGIFCNGKTGPTML